MQGKGIATPLILFNSWPHSMVCVAQKITGSINDKTSSSCIWGIYPNNLKMLVFRGPYCLQFEARNSRSISVGFNEEVCALRWLKAVKNPV